MGWRTAGGATGWCASAAALLLALSGCVTGMRPPEDPALDFRGPIRSSDVGEGGRVYIALCSACHRGRVNPRGYRWTPAQMRHQIRRGNQVMPPLPEEVISDAQVEAVLAYLAVTGALEGELPPAAELEPADDFQDVGDAAVTGTDERRHLISAHEDESEATIGSSDREDIAAAPPERDESAVGLDDPRENPEP